MAIRKRGDSWQIDYFDPLGKRVRKNFKKKKDAEAEYSKRVSLIAEKRYLDVKKDYTTTLDEVLKKYTENYEHQASYVNSKCHFIENFKEYFGKDTRLDNIKYVELETYRNHLRRKPTKAGAIRSTASINREIACLHHLFEKAAEWDMVERNPFSRGKSLLTKENNKRLRFLTEGEVSDLLKECPKHLKPIVVCALNTGMRKSEILTLKWSQVRNGFIYLAKTKNNEARQIPINDTLEALFSALSKEQGPGAQHVFPFTKGEQTLKGEQPVKPRKGPAPLPDVVQNVRTAFAAALVRAGIQDFRFHDLRHTFASHMVMRGASLKDLQELLGHKSMSMVLRYAHLTQEHKKKAVNLLQGLTSIDSKNPTVTKVSQNKKSRRLAAVK
jgi:integrase